MFALSWTFASMGGDSILRSRGGNCLHLSFPWSLIVLLLSNNALNSSLLSLRKKWSIVFSIILSIFRILCAALLSLNSVFGRCICFEYGSARFSIVCGHTFIINVIKGIARMKNELMSTLIVCGIGTVWIRLKWIAEARWEGLPSWRKTLCWSFSARMSERTSVESTGRTGSTHHLGGNNRDQVGTRLPSEANLRLE